MRTIVTSPPRGPNGPKGFIPNRPSPRLKVCNVSRGRKRPIDTGAGFIGLGRKSRKYQKPRRSGSAQHSIANVAPRLRHYRVSPKQLAPSPIFNGCNRPARDYAGFGPLRCALGFAFAGSERLLKSFLFLNGGFSFSFSPTRLSPPF